MNEQLAEIEHLFLTFADKTRLQLLYLLRDGELSVNVLCEALHSSQPKVSRHLAYLRTMNMVTTRREGKSIYYKLNVPFNPFGAAVLEETMDWLDSFLGPTPGTRRPKPERKETTEKPVAQPLPTNDQPESIITESEPQYVEQEMEVYLL